MEKETLLIKSSEITEESVKGILKQAREFKSEDGKIPNKRVFKSPSGKYVLVFTVVDNPGFRGLTFELPNDKKIDERKYKIELEPELLKRLYSLMTGLQLINY